MDQLHVANLLTTDAVDAGRWRAAERVLSLPAEWRVQRNGDLAWLDPMPSFEWYAQFYNEAYPFDTTIPVFPDDPAFEQRRLAYFTARLERTIKRLGRRPAALLDVGAGDGLFLAAAKKMGIEAAGIDISARACRQAAQRCGIEVVHGDLLESRAHVDRKFDVIVMNHVLEHLLSPLRYVDEVRRLLAPDGLYVIEIPQQFINPIDLVYRAARFRRPFGSYSLHHPFFYRESSIIRLLDLGGFRVEHLTTWLPGQVFHSRNPFVTKPLQALLWLADRLAHRGHIIEVFARPK